MNACAMIFEFFTLFMVILVSTQAQPNCGLIEAPDGSRYSLAHFANMYAL